MISVNGGDVPPIDGDMDTDIEGDDKLRRDREHGGDEARGKRGAEDETAAPGHPKAAVVVGVEV